MCLRVHSRNSALSLSPPLTAALSQYWPNNAAQHWSRVVSRYCAHSRLLRLVGAYRAFVAMLFYWLELPAPHCTLWLLTAESVHMSCGSEWVRPIGHTIISCLSQCLPGPHRKRPDTDLKTQRMGQDCRIILDRLRITFVHVASVCPSLLFLTKNT